jgi:protein-tyrosine phosphatase
LTAPRILFVCTGNICRSPTAEGVLLHHARASGLEVVVDSAGISAEELGNPPDARARQIAERRGYLLPNRRARQVRADDYAAFDRILAMTTRHLDVLERRAPAGGTARLELFMSHAPEHGLIDVPDPWYGGVADYEHALDLIEAGIVGLLRELQGAR